MKRLFTIDLKDYKDSYSRFKRPSVRGIIIRDKKRESYVKVLELLIKDKKYE